MYSLDLSYNRIRSLEGLHGAVRVRDLNISGNFLVSLDYISALSHLEQLYAADNFIESKGEALKLKVRQLYYTPRYKLSEAHYTTPLAITAPYLPLQY